jgi:hypothetical protein
VVDAAPAEWEVAAVAAGSVAARPDLRCAMWILLWCAFGCSCRDHGTSSRLMPWMMMSGRTTVSSRVSNAAPTSVRFFPSAETRGARRRASSAREAGQAPEVERRREGRTWKMRRWRERRLRECGARG